jgi:hypothetical protein
MTEAERAAERISELLPETKSGSLMFFGEWFGGGRDNWHTIVSASALGDELTVRFDGGEELEVVEPRGFDISPIAFRIENAATVHWQWFYYGRPQTRENLCTLDYERAGDGVVVRDTSDWYTPIHRPNPTAAAVVID